jgi:hypothetical protein
MKFISLHQSPRKDKKYVIRFENPNLTLHFGAKGSSTFLDHHDETKRENYLKRHSVNEDWTKVNAGSLSAYLLWGPTTDMRANLTFFLDRFGIID